VSFTHAGTRGVAAGSPHPGFLNPILADLEPNYQTGETLVTDGLDRIFPPLLVIGTFSHVTRPYYRSVLRWAAPIETPTTVLVLVPDD
jgi:cell shape-determining protein MreC